MIQAVSFLSTDLVVSIWLFLYRAANTFPYFQRSQILFLISMDETLHPNPCRVSPQSERRLWPRQVPSADTLYLPLAVVAHAHSTASAGYLTPSPRARAAPPGGGDAPATSPVFSRRVLTRQLSAPFCCRSPSQAAVPSPWSRCKLYLLRLGLSGQDDETLKENSFSNWPEQHATCGLYIYIFLFSIP